MLHTHLHTHGYTQGFFVELGCLGILIESAINCLILLCFCCVPRAGLEPAQTQCLQDFKSCVSTNSTTRAKELRVKSEEVKVQKTHLQKSLPARQA